MNEEASIMADDEMQTLTPGQMLLKARLARNLSQGEVAEQLHLSMRVIKDIEEDQYQHFSAIIYLRGYLRSYAKLLGIDEVRILDALQGLDIDQFFNQNDRILEKSIQKVSVAVEYKNKTRRKRRIFPWISLVVVAVLITLVVTWWQDQTDKVNIALPNQNKIDALPYSKNTVGQKIAENENANKNDSVTNVKKDVASKTVELKSQAQKKDTTKLNKVHAKVSEHQKTESITAKKTDNTNVVPNYTIEPAQN